MDERFERLKKVWYGDRRILFNIIENFKYREGVFLSDHATIRCIKANKIDYLLRNFDRYDFMKTPYNVYNSLAHYPNLPMFSFNKIQKRTEMDDFNINFMRYMTGYDFLLDIDNPDIGKAYKTLVKVKQIFDEYKIPAWYCFSGKKGFHVRIYYDDLPMDYKNMGFKDMCDMFKKFAERFAIVNGFHDIDYTIFDLRRIAKTPYSIVYPYYMVALPLSDQDIAEFDLKKMTLPYNIARIDDMLNRGVMVRPGKQENLKKLFTEYLSI